MEKRGPGRPPLPAGERVVGVETALKPATLEQVDAVAAATGQKRANVIRAAVERTLAQSSPEDWSRRRAWATGVLDALPKAPSDPDKVQNAHGGGHHVAYWQLTIEAAMYKQITRKVLPGCRETFRWPHHKEHAVRQLLWAQGPVRLTLTDGVGQVRYEATVEFGA